MPNPAMRALAALATALVAAAAPAQDEAAPRRPDLVVILADDMGFSDLGCYGGEIDTPNLDALAAGGLRFSRFYNTGRCCPTRASLLTGLYPHRAGIGHMVDDRGREGYRGELHQHVPTIAEVLRGAGYHTAMAGKWHVTPHTGVDGPKHGWPLQRGFERFFGTIAGAGSYFRPATLTTGNEPWRGGFEDFYYTDAIGKQAAAVVRGTPPTKPLFLYVAFTAPHWPLHAPADLIAKYRGRYRQGWDRLRRQRHARLLELGLVREEWGITPRDSRAPAWDDLDAGRRDDLDLRMAIYAAQIEAMDRAVGAIVQALADSNRLQQCLILFLADNGGCAEGGRFGFERKPGGRIGTDQSFASYGLGWANASNTPFRLYKHHVHEGGIASPLIAHWPAGIRAAGRIHRDPAHVIDLLPTCMELAGASRPVRQAGQQVPPLAGVSLAPAFDGRSLPERTLFWEHEGNRAVLAGRLKLVARGARGPWELYDLDDDRTELHDLAAEQPERVAELAARWQRWAEDHDVLPLNPRRVEHFSEARVFELQAGDDLPRHRAPMLRGRPFSFSVEVRECRSPGNGVLLAQGGEAHGFSVFVQDGRLCFALRRGRALQVLAAAAGLPSGACTVDGALEAGGQVRLRIDGTEVLRGKVPGLLAAMPTDGLQVGSDRGGPVGVYVPPFAFDGVLGKARLELSGSGR